MQRERIVSKTYPANFFRTSESPGTNVGIQLPDWPDSIFRNS